MLNKFKTALYGSSNKSDEGSSSTVISTEQYNERMSLFSDRLSALTRSSSFCEDLVNQLTNTQNGNSNERSTKSSKDDSHARLSGPTNNSGLFDSNNRLQRSNDYHRHDTNSNTNGNRIAGKSLKFPYTRPEFLQLKTDDEIFVSADHQIRPIILPRDVSRLPWKAGYAECINAGKSLRNEDQASCYQDLAFERPPANQYEPGTNSAAIIPFSNQIPWVYFGIFDGHAGAAVAVAAAAQLHHIVAERLNQIADILIALEFGTKYGSPNDREDSSDEYKDCEEKEESNTGAAQQRPDREIKPDETTQSNGKENPEKSTSSDVTTITKNSQEKCDVTETKGDGHQKENKSHALLKELTSIDLRDGSITADSLIIGALETAFCEMDSLIARDKQYYKMPGGCTAIVSLFILGKLYVCNAGDSRAIVYKGDNMMPMSHDFTPTSERERILKLGQHRPELMGPDFTHLEFVRRPTREDIGKQMLYKDAYMTGWSMKVITHKDLRIPLVWGEGKRSRVLATIGVTRGFGDHELRAQYGSVPIKPFLTAEPEVKVLPLESDENLTADDVLIMGTDGLWDVISNHDAANIVKNSFGLFPESEESRSKYRYITAAQDLVIQSRGSTDNSGNVWRTTADYMASLDDIAVFVIPLKQYRDEYIDWKRLHLKSLQHAVYKSQDTLYYFKT